MVIILECCRNAEGSQGWKDMWCKGSGFCIQPFILEKNPFLYPRAHSSKLLHARATTEKHLQMPLHQSGGKWANAAEQTTAQGFAFVFMALNEPVSLLKGGEM